MNGYLFQPGEYQADYVTIYQETPISKAEDIDENAAVHINPRGRALLERVMPRIEYWARLTGVPSPIPRVFELPPEELLRFVYPIKDTVARMVDVHKHNWKKLVELCMPNVKDKDQPFETFVAHRLTCGQSFYLERVASSHIETLTQYLRALFGDPRVTILLPKRQKDEFAARWPPALRNSNMPARMPSAGLRPFVTRYCELLDEEAKGIVWSLFNQIREYDDLRMKVIALAGKTRAELFAAD